jgi:hypothetical protein
LRVRETRSIQAQLLLAPSAQSTLSVKCDLVSTDRGMDFPRLDDEPHSDAQRRAGMSYMVIETFCGG